MITAVVFLEKREFWKIMKFFKLKAALYMYNILRHKKYHTLRSSLYMSCPSHNYHTWNNNDLLLPYPRVETIRMNFRYQMGKVWLRISEYIKCQRTWASFKNALIDNYLSRYGRLYFLIPGVVYFLFLYKSILNTG